MMRKHPPTEYSLRELAEAVGLAPRTVRSYIEKGLLPPPAGAGRAASYDEDHLLRLKAIRVMQELDGLTLEAIRRHLLGLSPGEIARIAARFDAFELEPGAAAFSPAGCDRAIVSPDEALASRMLRHMGEDEDLFREPPADREPSADWEPLPDRRPSGEDERILRERPESRLAEPARRRGRLEAEAFRGPELALRRRAGRAEPMTRIEVTPDIDLVVRGVQDERRIRHLERIAARIRKMLMGRG